VNSHTHTQPKTGDRVCLVNKHGRLRCGVFYGYIQHRSYTGSQLVLVRLDGNQRLSRVNLDSLFPEAVTESK